MNEQEDNIGLEDPSAFIIMAAVTVGVLILGAVGIVALLLAIF